ncbi:Transmembrane amino acid transporter protein [Musa troglodytarum]|uniref:Transmembrane amino acid transporter protein n=1 Tax=Musa troglodytarum TaxID=320322 RepID=A0A9E7JU35_9LILI|nr:Transmembrane amino acid transporter protein [Musa troglodytarum]
MGGEEEEGSTPLLLKLPKASEEQEDHVNRNGTIWTAIAHIITAVIGAGVLSLAWSMAQLGWIAGPIAMVLFAAVTLIQSTLLADCYRTPDPKHGHLRNHHYMDAVRLFLGERSVWICGFLQQLSLYGAGIAYTITAATSMRYTFTLDLVCSYFSEQALYYVFSFATQSASIWCLCRAIQKSDCYHREGKNAACSYGDSFYVLLFGVVQIVFSQIPDFHEMAWLSVFAAIMSFSYSFIGFALGLAKVIGDGTIKGGIGGIPMASTAQKVWRVSQALGDIAFAYPYSVILFEIEDTLKSPPPENQTMKKASMTSIFITTFFYLCCGCFGYAAFGNDTPGNLLTGFGFYEPYWLIDFANACIVVHLVGGYQVYCQPVFSFVERLVAGRFPNSGFVNKLYTIRLPLLPPCSTNVFRLCFRTVYVATTTGLAIFFPYFNQVLGVLGSFGFWPLAVYFPVEMYLVQKKIRAWTKKWVLLQMFSVGCFLVSVFAFIGSVEGVISEKLS